MGVTAIAAQWLSEAGWKISSLLAIALVCGLVVRRLGRSVHKCSRTRPDAAPRIVSAALVLGLVAIVSVRTPEPQRSILEVGEGASKRGPVRVVGTIRHPPSYREGAATIVLGTDGLRADTDARHRSAQIAGLLRLRVQHCDKRFFIGDRIAFRASLRPITNYGNPGEFDWAGWNRRRGIVAGAFVWSDRDIVELGRADKLGVITHVRRRMSEFASDRGDRGAAFVAAVTVGDRGGLDRLTIDNVRDAGMAHALAISGLHVGLLAGACLWLVRRALVGTRYVRAGHDAVRPACAAAMVAVAIYAVLGGAGVSVMRAMVMGTAALAVLALAGSGRPFDVLGTAAAALTIAIPGVACEPGFQLSFAATLSLVMLARRMQGDAASSIAHGAVIYAAVPLLAWLVTVPLVAEHFQRVSFVAPLVNLVAGPLTSVVVLLGLAGTVLLTIMPSAAEIVLVSAAWCASWLLALCDAVAQLSWSAADVISPGPQLAGVLSMLPIAALARASVRGRLVAMLLVVSLGLGVQATAERYRDDRLDVHFVSVGQGDATIVKLPGGKIAVVDGGRPGRGRLAIGPWLGRLGVRRIDYLVATHVQADHWGGLEYLAERFEIGEFWHNGGVCESESFARFLAALRRDAVAVVDVGAVLAAPGAGLMRRFAAGAVLEALAPTDDKGTCDSNDRSIVLSVRYGGHGVLLTGDLEAGGEHALLALGRALSHDVLKAPHHGSRTSSTQTFVDGVGPWLAVAACGAGNRYGFPHDEVVGRYRDAGIVFLSTSLYGAVSAVIDARGVRVEPAKKL